MIYNNPNKMLTSKIGHEMTIQSINTPQIYSKGNEFLQQLISLTGKMLATEMKNLNDGIQMD